MDVDPPVPPSSAPKKVSKSTRKPKFTPKPPVKRNPAPVLTKRRKPCAKRSYGLLGIAKRSFRRKTEEIALRRYASGQVKTLGDARGVETFWKAGGTRATELYHELKVLILELYLVNPYNEALRYVPTGNILRTELDVRKELDTAMADQGERYIYQRFPYVVLDDTPSSSSDSDSDPSEVSAATSQANIPLPQTPPAPVPAPVPPPPPAPAHAPAPMPSPPRAPAWDGLRRMRGQARKTTGLPPRHQMAQRDEPPTVHEAGESSRQAELRGQVQQVAQDLQGLRQEVHQHHTLLEDTRNIVLEILTSHLTLMEQVNLMGIDTQAWRITVEERFSRTLRQRIVAAFWQQVEVMRAGLVRVREFLVWLETVSFETRMIVLAVTMAAVAIIFSCLSYFIR
ncbi:hypothetical protein E3N88_12825 [Mikania micrantha]|uniref:Uncharacterized protein n=1 Tax=Mikania micrantha TaxID=192012 RepID=A0A5N6P9K1_9ASTR|nr:hypothetical protein E3N88_12825 [Mikania micrantha]